eukprot:40359_1
MIQTITTVFAIYTLSSASRLLLQQPPMYLPITTKGATTIQPVVSIPPVVSLPPPVTSGPVVVPQTTPNNYVPQTTPNNYVPQTTPNNAAPNMALTPPQIECKFSPPNPNSCSNRMTTVTNPDLNFHVTCSE